MRWAGCVAHQVEMRDAYKVLFGKPEEKRPRGRPRHTWEENIKMDPKEIGWEVVDSMLLCQSMGHSCEHGNEPSGPKK
jgi:hypothetical protein